MFTYHYPAYKRKGKKNTEYVPDAWTSNRWCKNTKFATDGHIITINGHVVGFTNQNGYKVVFLCKEAKYTAKYISGIIKHLGEHTHIKSLILPYCPSCGEQPPKKYLEELEKKNDKK